MVEGELYEGTSYLRSGLFGEAPTPVRAVSVFKKRVPCSASEAARRCIELESRLFPNRDLLAKAMDAIMAMIQGQVPAGTTLPRIEGFEIEMVERLITEPGTLLPHLMETTMHVSFTMMAGDVPGQAGSIIDQKRSVYTY